jgi:hypothetical protein
MMHRISRTATISVVLLATVVASGRAEVPKPGTVITKDNMEQYKEVLYPSLEYFIRNGMEIPVAEYRKYEWPPLYKESTEKFSGQVTLSADGRDLQNYVAGAPFPTIDPNDPHAVHRQHRLRMERRAGECEGRARALLRFELLAPDDVARPYVPGSEARGAA